MFPSPFTGRCYHASPIQQDYIRPAGRRLNLGDVGWHAFRYTYRSWLDSVGTSMGVQRKLMRHAQIATTMNFLWRRHDGIEACSQQQSSTDGSSAGVQRGKMKKAAEAAMNECPFLPSREKVALLVTP
jgi:hypothetical protein